MSEKEKKEKYEIPYSFVRSPAKVREFDRKGYYANDEGGSWRVTINPTRETIENMRKDGFE